LARDRGIEAVTERVQRVPRACTTEGMERYGARLVRVFVLDDHKIVRRGLLDLLSKRDIWVVGDAGSAAQATGRILELRPDVMVLDVQLQDGSGVQVCRDVRSVDPSIRGVLLTSAGDEEALILSVLAGAAGAVVKLAGTIDIVDAVRRVGAGGAILDDADTERVGDHLRARAENLDPPLTPQQAETLSLVLGGHTDQQIASQRQQPLTLVRDEVSLLIDRLTTSSARVDRQGSGRHRRDS
jgi:two-component system response regulator DevR